MRRPASLRRLRRLLATWGSGLGATRQRRGRVVARSDARPSLGAHGAVIEGTGQLAMCGVCCWGMGCVADGRRSQRDRSIRAGTRPARNTVCAVSATGANCRPTQQREDRPHEQCVVPVEIAARQNHNKAKTPNNNMI